MASGSFRPDRIRGASTPLSAFTHNSDTHASSTGFFKRLLFEPPILTRAQASSSFNPPSPSGAKANMVSPDAESPRASPGDRLFDSRSARRLSNQPRTFSQLPVAGGDDDWATSLLRSMESENAQDFDELPQPGAVPGPPSKDRAMYDLTMSGSTIPVESARRPTWSDSNNGSYSAPPFLPKDRAQRDLPPTPRSGSSLCKRPDATRIDHDETSSSYDLNIVTPSKSQVFDPDSPASSDERYTTASCMASPISNEYDDDDRTSPRNLQDPFGRSDIHSTEDHFPEVQLSRPPYLGLRTRTPRASPHASLPATASTTSSSPSRSTSSSSIFYDPDPLSRLDLAGKDERASIALSILSSESALHNSLHEATVHLAHARCLSMLRRLPESDFGSDGEEGRSAIAALDEAARRIAGAQREKEEEGAFDDAEI